MRKLKFRAWSPSKKIVGQPFDFSEKMFDPGPIENHYDCFLRDTVFMQFTGIHDENGVEIYEGDVVNFNGSLWEVRWEMASFWFYRGSPLRVLRDDLGIVVVGNVHANPRLMDDPFMTVKKDEPKDYTAAMQEQVAERLAEIDADEIARRRAS